MKSEEFVLKTRVLAFAADQRLKQDHEDVLLPAHPQELYPSEKELGQILNHKIIRPFTIQCRRNWLIFFVMGSLLREDDGAIQFWRLKDYLRNEFEYAQHWSDEMWKSRTAGGGTSHVTFLVDGAHISLHPIIMHSWCGCSDSLRFSLPLLAVPLLSYRPVHPPGLHLIFPWCGGQVPCALSLMRTLAPLPSMTLSQVMSPTCTSQSWTRMTLSTMTTPSA